jgi:protein required for attachment to host cells
MSPVAREEYRLMAQGLLRVARSRRRPLDRVWIVVADGGQARMLGITGDRRGLTVLREMASVDAHRRTRDLVYDRPSRSHESASSFSHAIAPRHDAHQEERRRFINQLAVMLIEDNRARQFDELILIIAAGLSGTLRDALDEATRARVRQTLVTDLTKAPLPDILERLIEAGLLSAPDATP